jgi:integrase
VAQRIIHQSHRSRFAFPRYNRQEQTNGNSASAALNKWLKSYLPAGCSIHSFRHSMRDRLRSVGCPSDMIDQIGGWSKETVGQGYGLGFGLEALTSYLDQITI